jgi:hypothetical protein
MFRPFSLMVKVLYRIPAELSTTGSGRAWIFPLPGIILGTGGGVPFFEKGAARNIKNHGS